MTTVDGLLIRQNARIRDALEKLQRTGEGILLLVNEDGRLVRTVTDGDLRRLILAGCSLEETLSALPLLQSAVAPVEVTEAEALEILNERQVDHLPLVDAAGRPVRVLLRRDVDARILLSTPHLGEFEMGFVEEAFRTNWIAPLGPNVDAFEREVASHVGVGHAAAVSSGTAALHLALHLLGTKPGDTVFSSSLTFVASANPILYMGAVPVFIDSESQSWNMSPQALARALADAAKKGKLPRAVVVVNLYGQSADMDALLALCDQYGVPIIEDAAESLGATYKGRQSGTFGRLGVFSFNGNKIITTSGGGMLVSDDAALIERARFLATQARDPSPWYEHSEIGYNYRMSNILAGVGRGQLRVLQERVEARRAIYERYVNALRDLQPVRWMPEAPYGRSTRWLSVCMLDPRRTAMTPSDLIAGLAAKGIEARHVWKPMHLQPLFRDCAYYSHAPSESFSDTAFATGVCLPSGSNLTEQQQTRICAVISRLFEADKAVQL
jgi:dTDP-4-amino-4,6-dideoxygalactose transaminase